MNNSQSVKKYFDNVPNEWDSLYEKENYLKFSVNKLLRKGLINRYDFTFDSCGDVDGLSVLDIGSGTGRYSVEFAKRGANKVVGIDFAPKMVDFSRNIAKDMGVSNKCEFVCGDFLTNEFHQKFDIIIAVGFFDYIKETDKVFRKISDFKPKIFIASFPSFTPIWGIQRHIRYYWIKKCPIFNYNYEKLEELFKQTTFNWYKIKKGTKGRGFLCYAGN